MKSQLYKGINIGIIKDLIALISGEEMPNQRTNNFGGGMQNWSVRGVRIIHGFCQKKFFKRKLACALYTSIYGR